ncbi:MAG: metallophosphoesterase [Clostridia bacterium]|nr:metallophosphoesterase [Clostridia bacterium]
MVYVTGDLHGDFDRFKTSSMKKLGKGDTLIVCGDFGFLWDGSAAETKVLEKLAKMKFNICFVEGTHENFNLLNSYPVSEWNGGKVHHIVGSVYHLMRGQVFNIEGFRIFTMGGGESPDIEIRMANDNWYPEESPNQQELIEGAENMAKYGNVVDFVITHEPSAKVKEFLQMQSTDKSRVTLLNTYFEELAYAVNYKKWYFGSLHVDKHISATQVAVFTDVIEALSGQKI